LRIISNIVPKGHNHCQLFIVNCQFRYKKTPSIPQSGRKANLPRYHPHLPFFTAHFSGADTPQTDNGVTRPALLIFQAAAPGRKPVCCTYGASTVPRSLKCKPTKGSPIAAFDCYMSIIPPRFRFCKCFFRLLRKGGFRGRQARDAFGRTSIFTKKLRLDLYNIFDKGTELFIAFFMHE